MDTLHIFRKIVRSGVELKIKNKKYQINYQRRIWEKFPKSLHRVFADSLAYIATWHLPLMDNVSLTYHFCPPLIEPVFFKMLLYTIPMNIFEYQDRDIKTSDLIKKFYNFNFQTKFNALNFSYSGKKIKKILRNKAVVLFSFGKESLLTYGLLKELGVKTILVFIKEPQSTFENTHKKKLADKFYDKFNEDVEFFPLSIGKLRQQEDLAWGWDIILSQYAFILVPYYFSQQARYLFFGNEQSCNFNMLDKEGFFINPVFEQSISAMQLLQNIPKVFFINTHVGSLVEPINEIFVTYILHHRYPEVGRFQMSCFSETPEAKKRRWCGLCEKCARMYIVFRALNISPERVGFYNSEMLSLASEPFYALFTQGNGKSAYGSSGLGRDEQLLAFYLAYRNGVKGELIDKFKTLFLEEAEKRKERLINDYFGIHSSFSLPSPLRSRTIRIFEKEREKVASYLNKLLGI